MATLTGSRHLAAELCPIREVEIVPEAVALVQLEVLHVEFDQADGPVGAPDPVQAVLVGRVAVRVARRREHVRVAQHVPVARTSCRGSRH